MAEASYAQQFLTQLSTRPTKYSSEHIFDPRSLPKTVPFQLPAHSTPFPAASPSSASTTNNVSAPSTRTPSTLSITLKPMKGPTATLDNINISRTTIWDLKSVAGTQTGYAPSQIKVLYARKPQADSRLLSEILSAEEQAKGQVELGAMFVGQPSSTPQSKVEGAAGAAKKPADDETPIAQGTAGAAVLKTGDFWRDLEGFLVQRIRDESVGKEAVEVFRKAWEQR